MMTGESGISLCDTCSNCECVFQSGVFREQCDFYKKKTQHKDEYYQAIIDVLGIIDEEDQNRRNELGVAYDGGSITVADRIRNRVLALKGKEG